MNILATIMAERRQAVADARRSVPLERLREQAAGRRHHSLAAALSRPAAQPRIIAEVKKASPSAGLLRPDYHPERIAARYARAGACGISVLTEPLHFLGEEAHLRAVRSSVDLPVLRKDFMCDPYQVIEAAAWGADVVLLILAALDPAATRALYEEARACGLDVLAETHTPDEVRRAIELEEAIIGVNSRDLKTLTTDLSVALDLAAVIPPDRLAVAESGIRTPADIRSLREAGYRGFLIGESLLSHAAPEDKLRELLAA
jgi:indole-3-glycerol phosphate synthase